MSPSATGQTDRNPPGGPPVLLRLDPGSGSPLDPDRLARAVEDLIRAIDPALADARVEIEVSRPRPRLLPDPGPEPEPAGEPEREPASEPASSDLGLDRAGRTLTVDGRVTSLTRREFELLAHLEEHRGVALSREDLMDTVWKSRYLTGDRTIDVHVRRLRVKLGRHSRRLTTLRGYGYRLD